MLIYELDIGYKSGNVRTFQIECVDEADASKTYIELMGDMAKVRSDETYVLETETAVTLFMLSNVEYVGWTFCLDTHKEALRNEATRRNGLSWNGGFTIPKEFIDEQLGIRE